MHLAKQIFGVLFSTIGAISMAHAACATAQWKQAWSPAADFHPAVFRPDRGQARLFAVNYGQDDAAIVGVWKFEMIAQSTAKNKNPMPDGTVVDFGTAAWHGDGTEFQTSGLRNPADGDVCQGVWAQIGPSTFQLNHYALAWTNGVYTGPADIRAIVRVDSGGNHYSGGFQTDVYLASVTAGHEFDETTKLVTITGSFTATRVTIGN
jgi:hypothetical protein